jgi:hypothetical protein
MGMADRKVITGQKRRLRFVKSSRVEVLGPAEYQVAKGPRTYRQPLVSFTLFIFISDSGHK